MDWSVVDVNLLSVMIGIAPFFEIEVRALHRNNA
jgi:hypothetical protein